MPQMTPLHETGTVEEEFDLGDLDLSTLSVTSMHSPAPKTDSGNAESWPPSCCCYPN